jgi:hypothetical protein
MRCGESSENLLGKLEIPACCNKGHDEHAKPGKEEGLLDQEDPLHRIAHLQLSWSAFKNYFSHPEGIYSICDA